MQWFNALSIRWKLQLGFFVVTMVTTIYNRILASHELEKMIGIAREGKVDPAVIVRLEANLSDYIFNSVWESGLEFFIQFFIIGTVAGMFVKPIIALVKSLQAVEQGDLTKEVKVTAKDEIGTLGNSFNDVLGKLNSIMRQIDDSGKKMGQSAFQIAAISREIAEVSKAEESRSGEVTAATDRLSESSVAVVERASAATENSRRLEQEAREGIATVQQNIREMEETVAEVNRASTEIGELAEAANQIHQIIDAIKDIAGQTNLLALNAAIEAARAGEQGRGFAVVADEVRKLAERTTHSAAEVSSIIDGLSQRVAHSTQAMGVVVERVHHNQRLSGETAQSIERLGAGISESASSNHAIADASRHQIAQMSELKATLEQLFATLAESGTKVTTTATIGHNLYEITEGLNGVMAGFVFEKDAAPVTTGNDKRKYPRAGNNLLVKVTQEGVGIEAVSRDMSLSGMKLAIPDRLASSAQLDLEIFMPDEDLDRYAKQVPLAVSARIAWQRQEEGRWMCGIEFVNLDIRAREQLKQCFAFYNTHAEYAH